MSYLNCHPRRLYRNNQHGCHRILLVTYNVATNGPKDADLTSLLQLNAETKPDLIAIGTQELDVKKLFFGNRNQWSDLIAETLEANGYTKVKRTRMVGIQLVLYVRNDQQLHFDGVQTSYRRTGLGGFFGNKGGVTISFTVNGKSVAIVNCHLAAGDDLLAQRLADYRSIVEKTKLATPILDHDLVLWMGDLNFRIDGFSINNVAVKLRNGIDSDEVRDLLNHDQLKLARENGQIFADFEEMDIKFLPTYRFLVGTADYDLLRKPAWTDRILSKVRKNNSGEKVLNVRQVSYGAHFDLKASDHKPVSALYVVDL